MASPSNVARGCHGAALITLLAFSAIAACGNDRSVAANRDGTGAGGAGGLPGHGSGGHSEAGAGAAGPPTGGLAATGGFMATDPGCHPTSLGGAGVPVLTAKDPPMPARTAVTCDGAATSMLSLFPNQIVRGSGALVIRAYGDMAFSASSIAAVGVNGQSTTWTSDASALHVLIPSAELAAKGGVRVDVRQDGRCLTGTLDVVEVGPTPPVIGLDPQTFALNASQACLAIAGGPFKMDNFLPTVFNLWHAGDGAREVLRWMGVPVLMLDAAAISTPGDGWIYAVTSDGQKNPDVSVASNWVKIEIQGSNTAPDIVGASPLLLPLAGSGSLTLTAKDHFSASTSVRARRSDGVEMPLGKCASFAKTCSLTFDASVTSVLGPVTLIATNPDTGDGAPFTVSVQNPAPHVDVQELVVTVSATVPQAVVLRGTGFVTAGAANQRSYVEEIVTGARLDDIPGERDDLMGGLFPPALVAKVATLQVRVVNPGGAGPALVSETSPVRVVEAPWIAAISPAAVVAGQRTTLTLSGTNLWTAGSQPLQIVVNADTMPFTAPVPVLAPTAATAQSWTFELPGENLLPGQASVQVVVATGITSNSLLFDVQ